MHTMKGLTATMTTETTTTVDQLAESIAENTVPANDVSQPGTTNTGGTFDAGEVQSETTTTTTTTDGEKKRLLIQVNFDNCPELHAKIIADAKTAGLPNATFLQQLLAKQYDFTLPEPSKSRSADTDGLTDEEKKAVKEAVAKSRKEQLDAIRKANAEAFKEAAAKARQAALDAIRNKS